jgi:hypothetical protein
MVYHQVPKYIETCKDVTFPFDTPHLPRPGFLGICAVFLGIFCVRHRLKEGIPLPVDPSLLLVWGLSDS